MGSDEFDTSLNCISISDAMAVLYEQIHDSQVTDVQFLVEGKILRAHRSILCCRGDYFRALLLGDFSEKTLGKPIPLTDVAYETFSEVLYFIYTAVYRSTISCDTAIQCMIYCDRITFLSGKSAACGCVCRHLTLNRDLIVPVYELVKRMSPAFDTVLHYIYELCSQSLNELCKQPDFIKLDRELLIDLVSQALQRTEMRRQRTSASSTP